MNHNLLVILVAVILPANLSLSQTLNTPQLNDCFVFNLDQTENFNPSYSDNTILYARERYGNKTCGCCNSYYQLQGTWLAYLLNETNQDIYDVSGSVKVTEVIGNIVLKTYSVDVDGYTRPSGGYFYLAAKDRVSGSGDYIKLLYTFKISRGLFSITYNRGPFVFMLNKCCSTMETSVVFHEDVQVVITSTALCFKNNYLRNFIVLK